MLDQEQITKNVDSITKTLKSFLPGAIFTNNANWLDKINYLDFLRDIGRHFSVNRMLDFESVKLRIKRESHLSFLEFNYMILQAYDFVELNKLYGCKVQIGGSDQWGNIVCGIELARKLKGEQLFGLTVPLIKTASGKKMGKTESGAIWLDKSMCSVYDYWQYFRNVDDNDVERFLRLFTDLKTAEIKKLFSDENCNINTAKKILATKATEICHGKEAAKLALEAAVKEFELNDFSDLQVIKVFAGQSILSIMKSAKIAESNSESKRLIKSGAVKIDGKKIQDVQAALSKECILSAGKKRISIKIAS